MENVNQVNQNESELSTFKLSLYGFFGGFLACLIDYLQSDTAAVSLKIRVALQALLGVQVHGSVNVLFISLLGALACNLHRTRTGLDAFLKGLAVFTVFNLVTPNRVPRLPEVEDIKASEVHRLGEGSSRRFFLASIGQSTISPNATVSIKTEWISRTKPEYTGFLGLNSLLNNTIGVDNSGDTLNPGQKVEILCYWDTNFRGYRYVLIKYEDQLGRQKCGWTLSGVKPNWWSVISPQSDQKNAIPKYTENIECSRM